MRQEDVLGWIKTERDIQDRRFPDEVNMPHSHWLPILMEEVGEVAKALVDEESEQALIGELTQVAAVAVKWMEDILRRYDEASVHHANGVSE